MHPLHSRKQTLHGVNRMGHDAVRNHDRWHVALHMKGWSVAVIGGKPLVVAPREEADGRPGRTHVRPLHPVPGGLPTGYRVSARLRLDHPPSGTTDCSAHLLADVDAAGEGGYAVRLRELTGVPYVGLLRRGPDGESVLAETLHGLNLGSEHQVDLVVEGVVFQVTVDGTVLLTAVDLHRLRGDHVGLAAIGSMAQALDVTVEARSDDELPPIPRTVGVPPPKTAARGEPTVVVGAGTRVDLVPTVWDKGSELRPEVRVSRADGGWSAAKPVGEWWLASGPRMQRSDIRATANLARVSFHGVIQSGPRSVVIEGRAHGYTDVSLSIRCDPLVSLELRATPRVVGQHGALLHAFTGRDVDDVAAVLCGPLQHARVVRDAELSPASELTAPLVLVQDGVEGSWTYGLAIPAADLHHEDEQNRNPDDQPFGMSLRGPAGEIQPTVFLPLPGRRAELGPDRPLRARLLLVLRDETLPQTYRHIVRTEYGYRSYREAVFGQSLTDTVLNLIDLVAIDPKREDSVDFQGSPSGWWSRAKGWIDIENDQTVRSTTAGVLLSAAYLTDDMGLYERRARPVVEFHLSRNGYGWTPKPGYRVYGDASRHEVCSTPVGLATLGPLHEMMRRRSPGIASLAAQDGAVSRDYWLQRSPVNEPLARYRLTRDPAALHEACRQADRYVAERIDTPRTEPIDPHDFAVFCVADWISLLELHLETGDRRYLEAAHREALLFATQVFVRPIPEGATATPSAPQARDRQIDLSRWWDPDALWEYPRAEIPTETAPRWITSISGMTFEAVATYRYSGVTMNPGWAAAMLRLSALADDDLLGDVAHNAITGRFTNYPGYYFRQQNVAVMQPDFPIQGPFDLSTLYYHHAPGQLGLTLDYLMTEHEVRSGGEIRFPAAFEENFVWFRYRTYGHQPGRFHGADDVWLWMPRGVVSLDNAQVSWISGERDRSSFHLSLVNASAQPQSVTVRFGNQLRMPDRGLQPATAIVDGQPRHAEVVDRTLRVEVPPRGHVAVVLSEVGPLTVRTRPPIGSRSAQPPNGDTSSFHFAEDTPVGRVRGMLLARPDDSGHDAYVQSTCQTPATLVYSLDAGGTWLKCLKTVLPAEWTVRVLEGSIRYHVRSGDAVTGDVTLAGAP